MGHGCGGPWIGGGGTGALYCGSCARPQPPICVLSCSGFTLHSLSSLSKLVSVCFPRTSKNS